jgi:predicted CopG family antitoxin
MNTDKLKQFQLPHNLRELLDEDPFWDTEDQLNPFFVSIMDNVDLVIYELILSPSDASMKDLNAFLRITQGKSGGGVWSDVILEYIEQKDPEFLAKITDDSESETCGLSVEDPDDFMRLVKYVAELFEDEELLKKIIAG